MRLPCRSFVAVLVLSIAFAGAMAADVPSTAAHGGAAITVHPDPALAGSTVTIEGAEFEPDVEVAISLEGITATTQLGTTMTDADGVFMVEVALPETATPGSYRVRAEGGDDVAILDFRVSEGTGGAQLPAVHERSIGFHRESPANQMLGLALFAALLAITGIGLLLMREKRTGAPGKG